MKEQAVISYASGMTNMPSDFTCNDGDLSECVNLEVKNGELKPVEMPVKLPFTLSGSQKLLYVHTIKETGRKNYIYRWWTDQSGMNRYYLSFVYYEDGERHDYDICSSYSDYTNIVSLGNTLIAYTDTGVVYCLYKDGEYKYLGDKIPEVSMSFNLAGKFVLANRGEDDDEDYRYSYDDEGDSDQNPYQTDEVFVPAINKFINDWGSGANKFIFPFFVRYALRLYNGEYVHQSAPVLMCPSTKGAPFVIVYKSDGSKHYFALGGFSTNLEFIVNNKDHLTDWGDIIKGVDIFVSRQVPSYDQSYTGDDYLDWAPSANFWKCYGRIKSVYKIEGYIEETTSLTVYNNRYYKFDIYGLYKSNFWTVYAPKPLSQEKFTAALIDASAIYYKYASLDPLSLSEYAGYTELSEDNGFVLTPLSTLELSETLTDDYMTHDTLVPKFSSSYNGRLNIANIKRVLFNGFPLETMAQNYEVERITNDYEIIRSDVALYNAYVFIRSSDGGTKIVKADGIVSVYFDLRFFFYPDTDAYKMVIYHNKSTIGQVIYLTAHPYLNGAYAFFYFTSSISVPSDMTDESDYDTYEIAYENMPNKLFTSDLNNPFYFPLNGINTVGVSEIRGIVPVTRAISQGQFGEYPLIAFCSDGNFALKVDSDGFYSGISPIQEDILNKESQLAQLENAITFITQRGLMMTDGAETSKLASYMDGAHFDIGSLDAIYTGNDDFSTLIGKSIDNETFLSYLKNARMAFDYSMNRLFIYNADKTYSYIYNFDNQTICKIVLDDGSNIISSALDYPDTIIQTKKGTLYSLYEKEDIGAKTSHQIGFAVTRPLKFGGGLALKSIAQIKNISTMTDGQSYVKYLLYGSNDNKSYYRVQSRYGKPYKFYRLAIYVNMLPKETFSGSMLTFDSRRNFKLR